MKFRLVSQNVFPAAAHANELKKNKAQGKY